MGTQRDEGPEGLEPSAYAEAPVRRFLEAVAAGTPAPGGGASSATAVALAAALTAMTARIPGKGGTERPDVIERADAARREALALAARDAEAYGEVLARFRDARDADDPAAARDAVRVALSNAADVPLAVAEIGADVASMAADLVEHGNPNLEGDAVTAVFLAEAGTRAAARLVEINLREAALADDPRAARVRALVESATTARSSVAG